VRRRTGVSILAAVAMVLALAAPAAAGEPTWEVVASGLDNPRGVTIGSQGAIYIAEAGTGGDDCTSAPPETQLCFGKTGAVTKVFQGVQRRVITQLPSSINSRGEVTGPSDVQTRPANKLLLTIGLGGDPALRDELARAFRAAGWLLEATPQNGGWRRVADIAGFEAAANPDGGVPDSNPNSVVGLLQGQHAVADAGGNSLVFARGNGAVSTIATFPATLVDAPPFLGLPPGTQIPMEAVPTSVAVGPDGAYYVGLLTGFPFVPGLASVMRVVPGEAPTVYATGFTNVMDVAFGPDGTLYVLEIFHNGALSGDPTGGLWRVPAGGGTPELLLTDPLVIPGGMAVHPDGSLVITNCAVCADEGFAIKVWL
jgi:hypothetical protein